MKWKIQVKLSDYFEEDSLEYLNSLMRGGELGKVQEVVGETIPLQELDYPCQFHTWGKDIYIMGVDRDDEDDFRRTVIAANKLIPQAEFYRELLEMLKDVISDSIDKSGT